MLEVCVDNLASVDAAVEGGAHRIELCSALSEGGLTPSVGFLKTVRQAHPNLTVFVMLRPRCGDFEYSQLEMDCIIEDMKQFNVNGVDGYVFGALTADKQIDGRWCELVKQYSNGLPITFHRAIDLTDPLMLQENVARIESLGFSRMLTSGLKTTAELGVENIKKLRQHSKSLIVVPGAGINLRNLEMILSSTGCKEFHSSASEKISSKNAESQREDIDFGRKIETKSSIVKNLVKIGQQFVEI